MELLDINCSPFSSVFVCMVNTKLQRSVPKIRNVQNNTMAL
jgi:hypothetical protein